MCGIFGVISDSIVKTKNLKTLVNHSTQRGKDSSGLIFNLQVSSRTKIVNNIYYAGHDFINKTLKENFKNVFYFSYVSTPKDGYFVILRN